MNVQLRTRLFETYYKDADKTKPTFKRVNKYQKNKDGSFKLKDGKKVRTKIKNPSYQYYLDIYRAGSKREIQYLDIFILPTDNEIDKANKKDLANSIWNKVLQEYAAGKFENVLPKYREQIDFIEYCQIYLEQYTNKDYRKVVGAINHFKKYLQGRYKKTDLPMASFTSDVANGFIKYLKKDSGLSGGTPISYLKKIKGIIKQAQFERLMNENPFQFLSTKDLRTKDYEQIKKMVLSESELQALFQTKCSNEFVRRAFFLAVYTGMGMAEIRTLKWKQIDYKAKQIKYNRAKSGNPVELHLHPFIEKLLFGLDRSNELVFADYKMPSDNGINKVLKTWIKNAGIDKHITFYCARHLFGVRTLRTSKNLKVVADIMGHSTTRYTEVYARIIDDEDVKAVESLPDISIKAG